MQCLRLPPSALMLPLSHHCSHTAALRPPLSHRPSHAVALMLSLSCHRSHAVALRPSLSCRRSHSNALTLPLSCHCSNSSVVKMVASILAQLSCSLTHLKHKKYNLHYRQQYIKNIISITLTCLCRICFNMTLLPKK